jgi:signal transduction histidine kinase/ActR/RegA family two-component response regulator
MGAPPAITTGQDHRRQQILLSQVRLLYANTYAGVCVTVIAAALLGRLEWGLVPHPLVTGWWVYMGLVSLARCAVALRFSRSSPDPDQTGRWILRFAGVIGLSGLGWGAAGVLLYPEGSLTNQVILVFIVGGMMLGAASLLAARPEAFLAFLIPAGIAPSVRLLLSSDQTHVAMGILGVVFTIAILITTWRIHHILDSSLRLRFENLELLEDLRTARRQTELLNQALEIKVQERTAELTQTAEQLRTEIATRERTEEELLRARKLESLGVLAGGIAHDFNNFLTVVQGNIELAKARMDPTEPVWEILNDTAVACQRAAFLSTQLLTFAKGGTPVRRLVSIKNLVVEAVQLVRAGTSLSVSIDIAEDLRFAHVDAGQIGQVLHNILLNARQAMRDGGILEIRAENEPGPDATDGPRVRIAIRDYGCGIPAEIRPRIFDPYFTTKPGGSGLGLATSYAIVSKHGGHIMVDSTPGVGTVFTIDLPASYDVPAAEPPPDVVANRTGTERLLVMDDEEPLRKLLKTVLSGLGYEVETARDGAEAIALYEKAREIGVPFDAVILDLTVSGGMGGLETAAKLKELDPSSKLIVSSGYSASSVMSDFTRYQFDAVLPKPWSLTELSGTVRKVLRPSHDRQRDS